ncbi:lysostaphin resistance A-like protein [Chloroflexota bacterium]
MYLVAIIIAELVTTYSDPLWGIGLHTAILIAIIIHATIIEEKPRRNFILSLAIVPLIRILSLVMPLVDIPQIWWLPIVYVPILAAAIVLVRILGYTPREVGFTFHFTKFQLLIGILGIPLGILEYLIIRPEPWVTELTLQAAWLPAVLMLLTTGVVEEYVFRGILQKSATDYLKIRGIIYVSIIFAVLHMGFQSFLDIVFVFAIALFFAWVVRRSGSLLGVILCHGFANIMLFIVAPFTIS